MIFDQKRILITGGSSGIGLMMAQMLASEGAQVVITGRSEEKLNTAAETHANISSFVCDIASEDDIVRLRDAMETSGGVDVLINNAGVIHLFNVLEAFPLNKQLQEIDIDISGVVRMVHYFLPMLLKRESVLVNVSSGLAYVPYAAAPVYSASKAFVHAYTESLRVQLANTSVRVVELMPPVVDTPMADVLDPSFPRMAPEKLVTAFIKGIKNNVDEITPGQSAQLKILRRLAPAFIFKQINKNVLS
ncbi:MAG: SDR family NAD(P)-dependent oxidoreductase [Aggregatilineales bacterium]